MDKPSVTVITPSTHDRDAFNQRVISQVQNQDYPNIIEHLFDYDNLPIGSKRNRLCEAASGDIIVTMDSDDVYATDWVSKSVESLRTSGANVTGLFSCYFYDGKVMRKYQQQTVINGKPVKQTLVGATLCYWRDTWLGCNFKPVNEGEEHNFVANAGKIYCHDYIDGFCAILHGGNTSSQTVIHSQEFTIVDNNEAAKILSKFYI